ncbi:MAG: hypothetical protein KAI55_04810 [Candidatus Aenigmarchaeota archaeon]|nr:hypothetical protein [Candidatus Aenigmarchaeota archaeon]
MGSIMTLVLFTIIMIVVICLLAKYGTNILVIASSLKDYFVCVNGEGGSKASACINVLKSAFIG